MIQQTQHKICSTKELQIFLVSSIRTSLFLKYSKSCPEITRSAYLANRLGVTPATLSRISHGICECSVNTLRYLFFIAQHTCGTDFIRDVFMEWVDSLPECTPENKERMKDKYELEIRI